MILHKNFCAFFQTKNMSFPEKVVGVNHLFWILKSDHLRLTCFFDFFWREMSRPKNKNAQEKAVHFFFSTHVPNSILRYFIENITCWSKYGREHYIITTYTRHSTINSTISPTIWGQLWVFNKTEKSVTNSETGNIPLY